MFVAGYRCTVCDARYGAGEVEYTCRRCGIEGILDVEYDYDAARRVLNRETLAASGDRSHWRYLPLLPLPSGARLPRLTVGWTPIYDAPALARDAGLARLWVKDDGRNPTGSFKDRASSVGAARAVALGRDEIACASTGNAASSLSGFAADFGLRARIFVPKTAPEAKVSQLLIYGATVFLVEGTYDEAWRLCQDATERFGWYNRNCAVNPHLVEGKKTCGLELAEQLAAGLPDWVALSVGDGCSIAGVYKGMCEMQRLGVVSRTPRLLGVQAAGAAPIAEAARRGDEKLVPVAAQTLADSISVGTPRNWRKALRAVKDASGAWVTVSDQQILEAMPRLARLSGVFGEPTAAAALAGVYEARQKRIIAANESVLVVSTGSGLKDARGAMRAVKTPAPIAATLEEVRRAVERG